MKITERFEGLIKHQNHYTFFGDIISDEDIEICVYPCLRVKGKIQSKRSILCEFDLTARDDIKAGRYIECNGELKSGGNIEAMYIEAFNIKAKGRVYANGDIKANDCVIANTIRAGADLTVYGPVTATKVDAMNIDIWGELTIKGAQFEDEDEEN